MTIISTIGIATGTALAKTAGTLLATDFASGIVHWLEDSYGKASWPIIGKAVIEPNIEHHFYPRKFTKTSVWSRNNGTLPLAAVIAIITIALGVFNIWWALALILGGFANEIHCWAHRSAKENGKVISMLQKIGILQSAKHHARHHTDPKNRTYCTITNFVNPILDHVKFFQRIEWLIEKSTGVTRRIDESVRKPKQHRHS